MEKTEITTVADMLKVMETLPENVVSTPAGGNNKLYKIRQRAENGRPRDEITKRVDSDLQDFFETAMTATKASLPDKMHQLDSDLLLGKSGGLARLVTATETAAHKARFRPKPVSPKTKIKVLTAISELEGTPA